MLDRSYDLLEPFQCDMILSFDMISALEHNNWNILINCKLEPPGENTQSPGQIFTFLNL